MKEMQPESIQPNSADLTVQSDPSTLDVRGNIFMPEPGQGEQPPKQPESEPVFPPQAEISQEQTTRQVTPEMVQKAREAWEKLGKPKDADENWTREELIRRGKGPDAVAGASDTDTSGEQTPEIKIGPATWKNKDTDQQVNITGYKGKGDDGRDYVSIEGSESGVPLDEIEYPQEGGAGGGEPPKPPETVAAAGGEDHEEEGAPREEMNKLNQAVSELLTDEAVIRVMQSDNPDFATVPQLENFINEYMEPGDMRGSIIGFAKLIASQDSFSEISRRILFERLLEKIISMADETPDSPYGSRTGNLYVQTNLQGLLTVADARFHDYYPYFANLVYVREVAHELNRNLSQGELYKKFVTESLRTSGLNFMHNDIAGVNAVVREYERASSNMVRHAKNWFSEKEVREIDSEVSEIIKGTAGDITTGEGRPLTEWEINRALIIGKILFAGTQRMAMYAALGDLPSDAKVTGRIGSIPYEYIARTLFPFKTIAARFFAGAGGPKRLMERAFLEHEAQLKEEGTLIYPIFGLDKRTILMDTYGALDSQSHSWRAELMFFGAIQMNIDGEKMNLLEYLNRFALKHGGDPRDPVLGGKGVPPEARKPFSDDVRETVLGQRLYLPILARYGNFDSSLKADIWKKIILLTPSTIVSVIPDVVETSDNPTWEGMRHKLYAAENRRINRDAASYKAGINNDYIQTESGEFNAVLNVVYKDSWTADDFNKVLNYMGMSDASLNEAEKNLLQKIVKKGFSESSNLSSAKLPFNFAIVDAPEVAWAKTPDGAGGLADEDMLRILLSDQQSFAESWGEMNTLMEHPTLGLREHMKKAVNGIGMVIGRRNAQEIIRPFIIAYLKMASTYRLSEWIGDLQKITRQPTSEMEKYYRESHISFEANEREITLEGMAQDGSISDDISEKRISDLDIVKKKTKSSRGAVMGRMIRLILLLLGPEAGLSFLKILLPEDLLRSLQKK